MKGIELEHVLNFRGTSFPLADANGNCVSFIDNAGNVQAHYTYDAFGGTASQSGDMVDVFRFRFSSKYLDDETGLYYYGYRFYDAGTGRWLSRDPLAEMSFSLKVYISKWYNASYYRENPDVNGLYVMVGNNLSDIDYLGLARAKEVICGNCKVCVEKNHNDTNGYHIHYNCPKGGKSIPPSCRGNGAASLPDFGPSHGYPGGQVPPGILNCKDLKRYIERKKDIVVPGKGTKQEDGEGQNCCVKKTIVYYEPVMDDMDLAASVILTDIVVTFIKTCSSAGGGCFRAMGPAPVMPPVGGGGGCGGGGGGCGGSSRIGYCGNPWILQ